jgi:hypothetical protein
MLVIFAGQSYKRNLKARCEDFMKSLLRDPTGAASEKTFAVA